MSDYLSSENQVACLAQAIHNGEYPSIAEATRENPYLYGRVKNRVTRWISWLDQPAMCKLLNNTKEEGIILWIIWLNDIRQYFSISILKWFINYIFVNYYIDLIKSLYTCGTK